MTTFKPLTFKLSSEQRGFLRTKLQQQDLTGQQTLAIPPRPQDQPVPLSYAQEWMWLLEHLASPNYNMPLTIRLTGPLDRYVLEQSLAEIVHRHSVLRTVVDVSNNVVLQSAPTQQGLQLQVVDLSKVSTAIQPTQAWQSIQQSTDIPFDLTQEPPVRMSLLRLHTTEHWLHITFHHITSDDQSFSIFLKELVALYTDFSKGQPSSLPALPIQYEDYAVWQRHQLTSAIWEQQLCYWRRQLQDSSAALDFPKPRNTQTVHDSAEQVDFSMSAELTNQVKAFSRQSQVTLFATLLTALRILLYRYTYQTDLRIGIPVSLRIHPTLKPLMGVFINTLAIRLTLTDALTSHELLTQVQQTIASAQEHQDIPFHKVMEALQTENSDFEPKLEVMFDFQNSSLGEVSTDTLTFTPLEHESSHPVTLLSLHIEEKANQIYGTFRFNPKDYDREIMQGMPSHFQSLLLGMIATPTIPITRLPILTAAEIHKQTIEWNHTPADFPTDKCLHQLFEAQVNHSPNAVAVLFKNEQLTYQDLNQQANQLAHHLQALGVMPEDLIGIFLEKSIEVMIAILGVLKAGGAYVPLDPDYPDERINFILSDAQVSILITQKKLKSKVQTFCQKIICLDEEKEHSKKYSILNSKSHATSKNLAYIIYTSGSTGQPKGVAVEHMSIVNFLEFRTTEIVNKQDLKAVILTSSICFDASIAQIFPPLLCGGKIIIIPYINQLLDWLEKEKITCLTIVPSVLEQLLKDANLPKCVKIIGFGGEAVSESFLKQIMQNKTIQKVFNLYGPTETTICACTNILYDRSSNR